MTTTAIPKKVCLLSDEWSDAAKTVPYLAAIHVLEMLTCNSNSSFSTTNNHDGTTIRKSSREKKGKVIKNIEPPEKGKKEYQSAKKRMRKKY